MASIAEENWGSEDRALILMIMMMMITTISIRTGENLEVHDDDERFNERKISTKINVAHQQEA